MNNNILLQIAVSILPILAILFVGALLLYKIYIKIRSRYNIRVNCWFCNSDTSVPYTQRNSWNCPRCEQYNGFTKDGDYNRDIIQQRDCSANSSTGSSEIFGGTTSPGNGFCDVCNDAQRIKVEKLAQFEPKNEARFDQELKVYKAELEKRYQLCSTCEYHLKNVLREKKKLVLGTKFLDFIMKGAELIKQPHFNQLQKAVQYKRKRSLLRLIALLTLINVWCLCVQLPHWTSAQFHNVFGRMLGQPIFIIYSHILALMHVLASYCANLGQWSWFSKIQLFLRTVVAMVMYSMGLTLPQMVNFSWQSLFCVSYPFIMLGLCFLYTVVDGLKLSRFIGMLLYWSAQSAGVNSMLDNNGALLLASIVTLLLSLSKKLEPASLVDLHDTTANSFHKLCADDYLSDETMSMLSQQLSGTPNSSISTYAESSVRLRRGCTGAGSISPLSNTSYKSASASGYHHNPHTNFNYLNGNGGLMSPHPDLYNGNVVPTVAGNIVSNHHQPQQPLPPLQYGMNSPFVAHAANIPAASYNPTICNYPSQQHLNATPTPMLSPFSISSNAVYQVQRQNDRFLQPTTNVPSVRSSSNLLLPSRFNQNYSNGDAARNLMTPTNNIGFTNIDGQNLSRTSSQSSGFESQHSNQPQNTLGFEGAAQPTTHSMPALDAQYNCATPIDNYSCGPGHYAAAYNNNKRSMSLQNHCEDTFNLRKFNEDLPTIRRGDLLRKWNENRLRSEETHIG